MKSSILYAGAALACALGLSACGGGDGDLPLTVSIAGGVTKEGLVLRNNSNGDEIAVPANAASVSSAKYLSTDDEFNISHQDLAVERQRLHDHQQQGARQLLHHLHLPADGLLHDQVTHDLGVTVNGLTGSGLVLVNGSDRQAVTANAGADVTVRWRKCRKTALTASPS
jgi:hypothetical protein